MDKMKYSLRLGTLYTLLVLCSFGLSAQTVTLDLPAHPGRQVSLCLLNGLQSDTIFNGMLDSKGQAVIAIPPAYKN
jgi:hypothetical protein